MRRKLSAAFLLGAAVGALAVWLAMRPAPAPPPPGVPLSERAEGWTHKELLEHLRAKGLPLEMEDYPGGYLGHPAADFTDPTRLTEPRPGEKRVPIGVLVVLCHDRRCAVQQATTGPGGYARPNGFAWGRFAIWGDEPLLSDIRARLE